MNAFAVAVFSRPPIPGKTKTRLIPALGSEKAARVHQLLLERTVQVASAAASAVSLFVTDEPAHPAFIALADRYSCKIELQQGADLGQRMHHALEQMLAHHAKVLLVGSDCALHSAANLQQTALALDTNDMVFTPAEDGGYVLVGARKVTAQAFMGIDWGSSSVMAQTRHNLRAAGCMWGEMPALWDIDEAAEVQRAQALGLLDGF
jgi:uncharacterized protein